MGYYIESPFPRGKAAWLAKEHGAEPCPEEMVPFLPLFRFGDFPEDAAVVCVVDNGPFEAAALIYSEQEFKAFLPSIHDQRPRTWLMMDKTTAHKLANYPRSEQDVKANG